MTTESKPGIKMLDPQNHASIIKKADIRSYLWQGDCALLTGSSTRIGFEQVAQLRFPAKDVAPLGHRGMVSIRQGAARAIAKARGAILVASVAGFPRGRFDVDPVLINPSLF